jgi:hypothetical protein
MGAEGVRTRRFLSHHVSGRQSARLAFWLVKPLFELAVGGAPARFEPRSRLRRGLLCIALTSGNMQLQVLPGRVSGAAALVAAQSLVGRRWCSPSWWRSTNTLSNNAHQRSPMAAAVRDLPEHDWGGRW